MRFIAILGCFPVLLAGQSPLTPKDIIRRALDVDQRNSELALQYTYLQREDVRQMDGSGKLKEHRVRTFDITRVAGTPYRRLVARDDKPLSPEEQKFEEEKLRKSNEDRLKETDEEKQKRIAEWQQKQRKQRDDIREFPDAFDFRLAAEEKVDGVDVWVIDAKPHAGFKAKKQMARALFPNVECRFWIAKGSYNWVKAQVDAIDTISLGWLLVRVSKGAHLMMEQTRVNDEVWLPKKYTVQAAARILLVKGLKFEGEYDFSGYKKFQAESKIIGVSELNGKQ